MSVEQRKFKFDRYTNRTPGVVCARVRESQQTSGGPDRTSCRAERKRKSAARRSKGGEGGRGGEKEKKKSAQESATEIILRPRGRVKKTKNEPDWPVVLLLAATPAIDVSSAADDDARRARLVRGTAEAWDQRAGSGCGRSSGILRRYPWRWYQQTRLVVVFFKFFTLSTVLFSSLTFFFPSVTLCIFVVFMCLRRETGIFMGTMILSFF